MSTIALQAQVRRRPRFGIRWVAFHVGVALVAWSRRDRTQSAERIERWRMAQQFRAEQRDSALERFWLSSR